MAIEVIINGRKEEVEADITVTALLKSRNVRPEMVAVEINGRLVPKDDYPKTTLKSGDQLEYLHYMSGGAGEIV